MFHIIIVSIPSFSSSFFAFPSFSPSFFNFFLFSFFFSSSFYYPPYHLISNSLQNQVNVKRPSRRKCLLLLLATTCLIFNVILFHSIKAHFYFLDIFIANTPKTKPNTSSIQLLRQFHSSIDTATQSEPFTQPLNIPTPFHLFTQPLHQPTSQPNPTTQQFHPSTQPINLPVPPLRLPTQPLYPLTKTSFPFKQLFDRSTNPAAQRLILPTPLLHPINPPIYTTSLSSSFTHPLHPPIWPFHQSTQPLNPSNQTQLLLNHSANSNGLTTELESQCATNETNGLSHQGFTCIQELVDVRIIVLTYKRPHSLLKVCGLSAFVCLCDCLCGCLFGCLCSYLCSCMMEKIVNFEPL